MVVTLFLALLASSFYLGATLVLKHWSDLPLWLSILASLSFFLMASLSEVAVLQRARFAEAVVLIIALEVLFALALSRFLLGESYGLRDVAGIILLGAGLVLLLHEPQHPAGVTGALETAKSATRT